MKINVLIVFLLLLFSACAKKDVEIDSLDFTKVRDLRVAYVFSESIRKDHSERLQRPILPNAMAEEAYGYYSYLSLRSNNEFTFLIGNHFTSGNYVVVSKNELQLNSIDYGIFQLEIIDATSNAIQVKGKFNDFPSDYMVRTSDNDFFYLNLVNDFESLNKENDIRSVAFNTWRKKPLDMETDEEIKRRLLANLNYISAYMRVHMYGDFEGIHTAGIYSPFIFAKNGLHLFDWDRTNRYWKNIFFNDIQAEKAYGFIKDAFELTEAPNYSDNWLEYNEAGLRKIISTLESDVE